jgi:hypothetical protein
MSRALAFFVCALMSAPALAQIIYQPIQYQYAVGDQTFYYGGTNRYLQNFGSREARHEIIKNNYSSLNQRFARHAPVYSDALPYRDLTDYGYSAADAANEANRNAPLYFRKMDLLAYAVRDVDGTVLVPAKVPSNVDVVRPLVPLYRTGPTTRPGQIIIIPKNLLNRPLKSFVKPGKEVASAGS